jgi:hypothetical protein
VIRSLCVASLGGLYNISYLLQGDPNHVVLDERYIQGVSLLKPLHSLA